MLNRIQMNKFLSAICILLLLFLPGKSAPNPTYDFESTAADILNGLTEGTLEVDGVPLLVKAGLLDSAGEFTLGAAGARLSVVPPGSISDIPEAGGLGVNSSIDIGASLRDALTCFPLSPFTCSNEEGLLFEFDPRFVPDTLTLRTFGGVTGVRIFNNLNGGGPPRIPESSRGSSGAGAEVVIRLELGFRSLSLNIATGTDPALFVASIAGKTGIPVDISPHSCPNSLKSKGKMRAAILGTEYFDVSQIDPESVRLAGVAPLRSTPRDVATPSQPFVGKMHELDCTKAGRDGFPDLSMMFDSSEVVTAIEDALADEIQAGEIFNLVLEAKLFDGTSVVGEDVIVVKKRGK